MVAAECSLLARFLFVTVAAPLALLGSLLFQVSVDLEIQSLTNLKYAVEEEAAAVATEAEAARDVGQAALDQTEAELLQEKAEALDASVAEAQATELGGAEAVAGEQAAEDVGGSEIAEQVEEVASSVVKGLGELPANGMASVGASEAVADAAAEAVAGAAVSSVGVDAALAGAAGAIAEQGPKVVVAAQEEWALGSEEIQAANDERLAVEKEVQATALEGDVPVLEAGSYSSHDAAVASALTAAGYLAAASAAQMVVLMVQGPLALVVLTQWLLSAGASTMHQVAKVRTQDYDSLWLTGLVAQVALYGAVASMMVNPWADIVVMAARFEEVGDAAAQQLSSLPSLATKAFSVLGDSPASPRQQNSSVQPTEASSEPVRRLGWNLGGWVSDVVAGAEHAAEEVVNEVENATLQAVPRVVNATEALLAKSTKSAHKEIKDVSDAAREGAVTVMKGLIKPNTLTTTIRPLEVPAPPAAIPYRDFVSSAAATVGKSILYWIMPIVADLFFISLAFALFELAMGVGRYSSIYRENGLVRTASGLLTDICSGWVYGACALVAFWVLGILLAQELRPMAEKIQDTPLHPMVPLMLGAVCMLCCVRYAVSTVNRPGSYRLLERDAAVETLHQDSKDSFSPLLDALGDPKLELVPPASPASNLARCLWVAVAEILGSLIAALEGPVGMTAVSTTYKAGLMSYWMWGFVPWGHVLPEACGIRLPVQALLVCVAVGAVLVGGCLHGLRHKSRQEDQGIHSSQDSGVSARKGEASPKS